MKHTLIIFVKAFDSFKVPSSKKEWMTVSFKLTATNGWPDGVTVRLYTFRSSHRKLGSTACIPKNGRFYSISFSL